MNNYSLIIYFSFFLLLGGCIGVKSLNYLPSNESETVILLHGILNPSFFMKRIEWGLEKDGYKVVNWDYPSRDKSIQEHAEGLNKLISTLDPTETVHIVGFSLGSIIGRYYLSQYDANNVKRFVMIAPPNHGSEKVDYLYPYGWFRSIYGTKSIAQLKSSNAGFFKEMGIPPVEFGIIAGGKGDGKGLSHILPGDDDGAVSVQSAKLEGAKDFILLNYQHTALIFSNETIKNVVYFLKYGEFEHIKK